MKNLFLLVLFLFLHIRMVVAQNGNGIWQAQNLNLPETKNSLYLDVINENVAWMAVQDGDFTTCPWTFNFSENTYSRTIDGQTWVSGTYPNSGVGVLTSLHARDANLAWISFADFIESNKVLKTTNGGLTWTPENVSISVFVDFVHFFDNANGVVVGDPDSLGFEIFTTGLGGGSNWNRVNPANQAILPATLSGEFSVPYHAVEGNHVWFVTNLGRVFHSPSKGITWEVWNGPLPILPDVVTCHNNTCLLAFNQCDSLTGQQKFQIYRTTDKGADWENRTPPDSLFAVGQLRYIPGTEYIIGSFRASNQAGPYQTRISYDDGLSWEIIDEGTPVLEFDFVNTSIGYATQYKTDNSPAVIYRYIGPALTGVSEKLPGTAFSVQPNPTSGPVHINMRGEMPGDFLLTVSDAYGRVVRREMIENQQHFEQIIDLSGVPAGVYWVGLSNEAGRICEKVVKE